MQPRLELLSHDLVQQVLDEAFTLIEKVGIKVQSEEARQLLLEAGAGLDGNPEVLHIHEALARRGLETAPRQFQLFNRAGEAAVQYGGDAVHFNPGSSGVHVLDPETLEHRPAETPDLVRVIQVAEMLPQYAAQSTAVVCNEIPKEVGDLYRLFLVLLFSDKPVITGSFSTSASQVMYDMLAIYAGSRQALAQKPQAVFDVCPTPPLIWSNFGSQCLIDLARAGVPAQIVSMPLAGAGAPVTLIGSVVQHAAECISGILIHQLANPGAPIVWGGAPAIFDMRQGTTPMGAVETAMIDAAYTQVGKALDLPTHTYLGASDAKSLDYQAGLESGVTALIAALARINMVSGAGMLDFLACISPEKLVMDADAIGMALRMNEGIQVRSETLAIQFFQGIDFKPDFLKQKATRQLFAKEQFLVSPVIDRGSIRAWQSAGCQDAFKRARVRTDELLKRYQRPSHPEQEKELIDMVSRLIRQAGLEKLPELPF